MLLMRSRDKRYDLWYIFGGDRNDLSLGTCGSLGEDGCVNASHSEALSLLAASYQKIKRQPVRLDLLVEWVLEGS